jgi:hypothetical protein
LKIKTAECEVLEAQVRKIEKRVETLEAQLKEQEQRLNDEEFLFTNSAAHKRLSFNLWVHNKYYQLQDSDGPNPQLGDVEELSRDLQKYVPLESYNMGTHLYEQYYAEKLTILASKISSWVRRISDVHKNWNEEQIHCLLSVLRKVSRTGEKTVQGFEQHNLVPKFASKRHFRILCVHLVSLAIYEHVLSSFAFGMSRVSSKQLYAIQNSILTEGSTH